MNLVRQKPKSKEDTHADTEKQYFKFPFGSLPLPGIIQEYTLDRDGPISSVKLYRQNSNKKDSITGKVIVL